jgi:hypothetical protein
MKSTRLALAASAVFAFACGGVDPYSSSRIGRTSASLTAGAFTSTASAPQAPVPPGATASISATVVSSTRITASVTLEILDSAGTRVAANSSGRLNFKANRTRTYGLQWTVPAGHPEGTHTVRLTVTATSGEILHQNWPAASFEVAAAAAPPPSDGGVPDQLLATFDAMPLSAFGGVTGDALAIEFARAPDWTNRIDELSVFSEARGSSLRQRYTPTADGSPVVMFPMPIEGGMEVWLSYRMLFETGWEWVKGGKLPGLAGGTYPTGGLRDDNGFSARFMWRTNGELSVYAYHHDRPTLWGEDFYLLEADGTRWRAPIDQWFTIRQRIKMNTGDSTYDGEVEVWIDGERKLLKTGLRWRKNTTYTCDTFLYSSFYGGGDPSWAPSKITYARFDDFKVASTAVGVD